MNNKKNIVPRIHYICGVLFSLIFPALYLIPFRHSYSEFHDKTTYFNIAASMSNQLFWVLVTSSFLNFGLLTASFVLLITNPKNKKGEIIIGVFFTIALIFEIIILLDGLVLTNYRPQLK